MLFKEFNKLYRMKARTKPVFTLSSSKVMAVAPSSETSGEQHKARKDKGIKRPVLGQWLQEYKGRQEQQAEKRFADVKKMHEPNMSLMERF